MLSLSATDTGQRLPSRMGIQQDGTRVQCFRADRNKTELDGGSLLGWDRWHCSSIIAAHTELAACSNWFAPAGMCAFVSGAAVNHLTPHVCVLLLLPLPPPPAVLLVCPPQLPADLGKLADDVTGMGMRSALAHAKNDRRPLSMLKQEKTKKKRKLNLRHMTNTHLAHLLTDAQYTSID